MELLCVERMSKRNDWQSLLILINCKICCAHQKDGQCWDFKIIVDCLLSIDMENVSFFKLFNRLLECSPTQLKSYHSYIYFCSYHSYRYFRLKIKKNQKLRNGKEGITNQNRPRIKGCRWWQYTNQQTEYSNTFRQNVSTVTCSISVTIQHPSFCQEIRSANVQIFDFWINVSFQLNWDLRCNFRFFFLQCGSEFIKRCIWKLSISWTSVSF